MPVLILFLVFVVLPAAEIYVFVVASDTFGFLTALALIVATSILGAALMRVQGRNAWNRFLDAVAQRRVPGKEALDGALVLAGGLLLTVPGFITDVFGAILLAPPTRTAVRALLARHYSARLLQTFAAWRTNSRNYDVEGDVIDVDQEQLDR